MRLKPIYTLLLLLMCLAGAHAQSFLDDFNDGDLAGWGGTPEFFVANASGELQLNGDCAAGGDHYISQNLPTLDAAEWSFQVRLDFDPSASNHTRIFLQSDVPDLSGDVYGYFVRVGEDGTGDVVKLWRSNGASASVVITGVSSVATAPNVGIKVVRTVDAEWQLWVDADGGTDYVLEGSDVDDTYNGGAYAGIYCNYSSTRCDKFFYDDFYINPLYFDNTAPALDAITVISSTQLLADFNEPLETITAETETYYTVTGGVGNPIDAAQDADPSKVLLTFAADFPEGELLTLAVNGVEDISGNATSGVTGTFTVFTIQYANVVINEIMADPEPPVGLPNEEYVELYNTTTASIDLTGCALSDASGPSDPFSAYILAPGAYVILCDDGAADAFAAYPNVLPVSGFPSLNNDGDELTLANPENDIIHSVTYTNSWYNNAIKADGGWSLEMIDPNNPCQGATNWTASESPNGGTPGTENSVFGSNPDTDAPRLISVFPQTADTILISFSESVLTENILLSDITITDAGGSAIALSELLLDAERPDQIGVVASVGLSTGVIYTCTVTGVQDCSGNVIGLFSSLSFGIPEPAAAGDVAINEILFNAVTDGFDYVELYNRSNKIIDLSTLTIAELKLQDTTVVDEFSVVSSAGRLLFPGRYVCATEDPQQVVAQYFTVDTGNFVVSDIPNFTDAEGIAVLYDAALNEIDHLHYYDDWHYALLEDEDGVSLERVNYAFPTQDANNWHSAASDKHFGTPGYQNSVFGEIGSTADLGLEYAVFSPDGDGYHDLLVITYNTEVEGYTGTVQLFDAQGRLVRGLVNNDLLGREGFFTWDGLSDDDTEAPSGIYIVYAEIFNLEGRVESFKIKCTLVRRQ